MTKYILKQTKLRQIWTIEDLHAKTKYDWKA